MAERQTRWLQVPVSERAWGFKSPLAHRERPRFVQVTGLGRSVIPSKTAFVILLADPALTGLPASWVRHDSSSVRRPSTDNLEHTDTSSCRARREVTALMLVGTRTTMTTIVMVVTNYLSSSRTTSGL